MKDVVNFQAGAGGLITEFQLLRSSVADGEFSVVATAGPDTTVFSYGIEDVSCAWYGVVAIGPGGTSERSTTVNNGQVSMCEDVGPEGRTLHASNGEVVLSIPPGAFSSTTTVTVREVSASPTSSLLSLSGVYEISPDGGLGAPAVLSIRYTLEVTHFEVAMALLDAAEMVTYDEPSSTWVAGARDVHPQDGYLVGTLDHFSYWAGSIIEPHGTSVTTYCSSGTICHDLSAYPNSNTRIAARDPQICYNCHGRDGTEEPLAQATSSPPAGATGPNVQAQFFSVWGQSRPLGSSIHPVVLGGLYCTACHDPHADRTNSPNLLKAWNPLTGTYVNSVGGVAPGNTFCWTCHGQVSNRRINYLVDGYRTRTGGDHYTAWTSPVGDYHGARAGTQHSWAPALQSGYLRDTSLECTTCHQAHGSDSDSLFRRIIGGRSVGVVSDGTNVATLCKACHTGEPMDMHAGCIECHGGNFNDGPPPEHLGPNPVPPLTVTNCYSCHGHGSSWTHTEPGLSCFACSHHSLQAPSSARTW